MLSIVLFVIGSTTVLFSGSFGFILNEASGNSNASRTSDIQYLHLLLADEKMSRLSLFKEVEEMKTQAANMSAWVGQLENAFISIQNKFDRYKSETDDIINGLTASLAKLELSNTYQTLETSILQNELRVSNMSNVVTKLENATAEQENQLSNFDLKMISFEKTLKQNEQTLRSYSNRTSKNVSRLETTMKNNQNVLEHLNASIVARRLIQDQLWQNINHNITRITSGNDKLNKNLKSLNVTQDNLMRQMSELKHDTSNISGKCISI